MYCYFLVAIILGLGLVSVGVLKDSAIAQMLPKSVEPSGLNLTGNMTGDMTDSLEESIPTANTTAYEGPQGSGNVGSGNSGSGNSGSGNVGTASSGDGNTAGLLGGGGLGTN